MSNCYQVFSVIYQLSELVNLMLEGTLLAEVNEII